MQNNEAGNLELDKSSMQIYPNPTCHIINVSCALPATFSIAEIVILDIMVKQLLTQLLTKDKSSTPLNTHILDAGIYFINLVIDTKVIETQKLIKE